MTSCVDYLAFLANVWPVAKLILEKGQAYPKAAAHSETMGKIGQCYQNAALGARSGELTYCEGYAMKANLPFPIPHAWLVNKAGEAVDVTRGWEDATEYYGICIPHQMLCEELLAKQYYGVFEMPRIEFLKKLGMEVPA